MSTGIGDDAKRAVVVASSLNNDISRTITRTLLFDLKVTIKLIVLSNITSYHNRKECCKCSCLLNTKDKVDVVGLEKETIIGVKDS